MRRKEVACALELSREVLAGMWRQEGRSHFVSIGEPVFK